MARLLPSDLTDAYLTQSDEPEIVTLRLLKSALSPHYTIFHSVHWSRSHKAGISFGELDFVVLNRSGDILVIEQKNGQLNETAGGLTKSYDTRDKNVAQQLHRSLDNLRAKIKVAIASSDAIKIDYLLYCPDYRVRNLNAVGLDRSRVIDAADRSQLSKTIESLLGPGLPSPSSTAKQVEAFFCQTFEVVPDIHAHVSESERSFARLSEGLSDSVGAIEMEPMKLRVKGTAGCGKSHVALKMYRDAIGKGQRPLLVCFTRPLREKLAALAPAGGLVQTWYGLCDQFLTAAGQKPNFGNYQLSPSFWRTVQDQVTAASIKNEWLFDTIIVDEGQDFESEWLEILRLFHLPQGDFIWLEDGDQNVFMKQPVRLDGFVGYRAKRNYRTPVSIARYIQRALPFKFENANAAVGLGVEIHRYANPDEQTAIVNKIVLGLLKQGFRYQEIAVLSFRGTGNSAFSTAAAIGAHSVRRFSGEYDAFGNQVFTEGNLLVETIGRFKGQQSPAVILTDVDPLADDVDRAQRLLFCGMTRATARLDIVCREGNRVCDALSAAQYA